MEKNDTNPTPLSQSGIKTFMLTDLESSTWLWEAYPEEMGAALGRHDELIETAVNKNAGMVIKPRGEGDGRFIVFDRATDALLAADDIQRAMAREKWRIPETIKVRIAIHTGEAGLRDGDYYGPTINRCARLRSISHGGQTLLTQVTYDLARNSIPQEISFLDLGQHKLKDIRQAERIYQLNSPGLPDTFPSLRTPNQLLQNLPVTLTSFIGRNREVAEVKNLLATRRLITIIGSGGVGKTRLAVQAASNALEHFPDGGHFVDLTSITNSALVTQYVMSGLGIHEDECCNPVERLEYYFQDKKMLLILDNCEHVLPGVAQLAQVLLHATANTTMLATSREPLGVVGETIWYIKSLSTPRIAEEVSIETLMSYEAVALFVERAAATSEFVLNNENAQAVVQVCARLDGIPLALELAAARTKVLSAADLAKRLDDRFGLLVSNQQVPHRQKTLRNLIDWSYDLLPENEKILLRRLSIFAGGWTLQASEQICAGAGVDSSEILDLLIHLVDRSLVIAETVDGGKRYRLLETIRQYGRERLEENQEVDQFACKHASYFTQLAERSARELWGRQQSDCLKRLDEEHDNLRAALEWLATIDNGAEMMLRLTGALWRFWRIRGHYQEGRMRLGYALSLSPNGPRELRAEALRGVSIMALQQGDYEQATALIKDSLALYEDLNDQRGIGRTLDVLGEINYYQGNYTQAITLHTDSLNLRTTIGDQEGLAISLRQLGMIARDLGDHQQAKQKLTQSLELCRKLADKILMARTLDNLGLVEHQLCNYERANQLFTEAVSIYQELNERMGISNTLQNLGNVAKDQGEFKQARAIYDECLELKQALGDKRGIAQALASLSEVAFYQGEYLRAAELAGRSLTLFQDLGVKRGIVLTLGLLAYTAQYNGEFERAAALAADCLRMATELNAPRPVAYCKEVFGLIAYARGDLAEARQLFLEAIDLFERLGDRRNVASARTNLARALYRQGDHEAARQCVDESLAISRELDIRWTLGFGLEILGLVHRSRHNDEVALGLFQESLAVSLEQGNRQGVANCLGAIAGLAALSNQATAAAILFGAAQRIRREIGARMGSGDLAEYEFYLVLARQHLAEDEFEAAWARGSSLTIEQVVEFTRIEPPPYALGIINRMEVVNEA